MHITYPYMVVSDVHFHNWDFGSYTTTDGINSRLQQTIDEFKRGASLLKESGGNCIIITGDLFHTRGEIKPSVFNPVYTMFKQLSLEGFKIFAIPGNHDLETDDSTSIGNAFEALSAIDNFNIFYYTREVEILSDSGKRRGWAVLKPWDEVKELDFVYNLDTFIDDRALSNVTLFAHVGLSDVVTGVSATISPETFSKIIGIKYVFCGHFHNHKRFDFDDGFKQSSVFSVGALTHQSFKDVDSLAGFIIVEDEETITHYESEAPKFVDYHEGDYDPEHIDINKFKNNYVRMTVPRLFNEEKAAIKIALETIGALRVIARTDSSIKVSSLGTDDESNPGTYVLGPEKASKELNEVIIDYMKSRYNKVLADNMISIFVADDGDLE